MSSTFHFDGRLLLAAVGLILAYAAVDHAVRRDGLLRLARRFHPRSGPWLLWGIGGIPLAVTAVSAAGWAFPIHAFPLENPLHSLFRYVAPFLVSLLTWQAVTRDFDLVSGPPARKQIPYRLGLLALAAGTWVSPFCLPAAVLWLTTPFGLWQHHATLPMRLLQAVVAVGVCLSVAAGLREASGFDFLAGFYAEGTAAPFFLLTLVVSHYFITALAKILLGPRWFSWPWDNRLHYLAASAYSWGWARFLPWPVWLRFVEFLRRVERPLQIGAFTLELLCPLALLHPSAAIAFCLGFAAFHAGVFLVSGLLFWDWVLADLALAAWIAFGISEGAAQAFGWFPLLLSLGVMAAFPLRHKLWKPMPLGWFDTPFTQRIHWTVRGRSGRWYGLYNDFMCPHERLYGKVHGCFFAPAAVLTYHLGEAWKLDLRDALVAAGPDLDALEAVRTRYGIRPVCERRASEHGAALRAFFKALNAGQRKRALPRALRWLKAPGDQLFYWGELPAYRRQEPVAAVRLTYREEFFDGKALRRLRDETVLEIAVDIDVKTDAANRDKPTSAEIASARLRGVEVAGSETAQLPVAVGVWSGTGPGTGLLREPTPKEIDDFLLSHAVGRLIDLPGMKAEYLRGDDGKAAVL